MIDKLKEKAKNSYDFMYKWTIRLLIIGVMLIALEATTSVISKNFNMPSFSWWSSSLLADSKSDSFITEVEAPGYNMRNIQYIDVFGRVCGNAFVSAGPAGMDCDFPPAEYKNWTIEDYKKAAKARNK